MGTIYLCVCCAVVRPVGDEVTPCQNCGYDGRWSRKHRRVYIRAWQRKQRDR